MEIERVITGTLDENCYILKKDGKCLLIDPGSDSDKIKKSMGDNKLVGILVTHSHFDHVGSLRDFLKSNRKLMVYKKSNLSDLEEKEIEPFKFKCYYTPGHSSDSLSFYFAEVNTLFVGDFIFKNTIGRTDLPTGSETDMKKSLAKLEEFNNDTKIYSGHGDLTTLEEERKNNPYLQ